MEPLTIAALLGLSGNIAKGLFGYKASAAGQQQSKDALDEQKLQAEKRQAFADKLREDALAAEERDRLLVAEQFTATMEMNYGQWTNWVARTKPYRQISRDIAAKKLGRTLEPVEDVWARRLPEPIDS